MVIHHIQRHPLTSGYLHADFYQVSLREKMRADVPLIVIGTSDAVEHLQRRADDGAGVAARRSAAAGPAVAHRGRHLAPGRARAVAARARPADPGNVTILTDPDVMVVKIARPRVAEEEAAAAETEEAAAAAAAAAKLPEAMPRRRPRTSGHVACEAPRALSSRGLFHSPSLRARRRSRWPRRNSAPLTAALAGPLQSPYGQGARRRSGRRTSLHRRLLRQAAARRQDACPAPRRCRTSDGPGFEDAQLLAVPAA